MSRIGLQRIKPRIQNVKLIPDINYIYRVMMYAVGITVDYASEVGQLGLRLGRVL